MTTKVHLDGTTDIDIREAGLGLGSFYYILQQSEHNIKIKRTDIPKLISGLESVLAEDPTYRDTRT